MLRTSWLALLVACGQPQDAPGKHTPKHTLEMLTGTSGWTADYDPATDRWTFVSAAGTVQVTHVASGAVASPDAFVHTLGRGTIDTRQTIDDGFAVSVVVPSGGREAYAVRHVGAEWLQCTGDALPDTITVCSSLKLRAH